MRKGIKRTGSTAGNRSSISRRNNRSRKKRLRKNKIRMHLYRVRKKPICDSGAFTITPVKMRLTFTSAAPTAFCRRFTLIWARVRMRWRAPAGWHWTISVGTRSIWQDARPTSACRSTWYTRRDPNYRVAFSSWTYTMAFSSADRATSTSYF